MPTVQRRILTDYFDMQNYLVWKRMTIWMFYCDFKAKIKQIKRESNINIAELDRTII